jgi:uncharacterized membrane protein
MATNRRAAPEGITDNDKLMGLLSYIIAVIVPLVVLATESKDRPFQRYHAVQSLGITVFWVVAGVVLIVVTGCLTAASAGLLGPIVLLLSLCLSFLWLVPVALHIYWAVLAYQGQLFDIPSLSDFMRKQGWLQ